LIVLGIDPGTATTGYGLIGKNNSSLQVIDFGVIETSPKEESHYRLRRIHERLKDLIKEFSPTDMAVEQLFFNTNTTTAITVGQARGIALLAAASFGISLGEYTPLQVKQAVTGYGGARKNQVQQMVKTVLGLAEIPRPDDAADALAIAICHINSTGLLNKIKAMGD